MTNFVSNRIEKDAIMDMLGTYKGTDNLVSLSSGKPINNQIVTKFENGTTFTSYGTLIGAKINGKLYLTSAHCFSKTTNKYTCQWCGLSKEERLCGIANGTIQMIEE